MTPDLWLILALLAVVQICVTILILMFLKWLLEWLFVLVPPMVRLIKIERAKRAFDRELNEIVKDGHRRLGGS